jgi:hypothetical protein
VYLALAYRASMAGDTQDQRDTDQRAGFLGNYIQFVTWFELWSFQYCGQRFAYWRHVADCDEERAS